MRVTVGKRYHLAGTVRVTSGWRGAEERLSDPRGLYVHDGVWEVIADGPSRGLWMLRAERQPNVFALAAPRRLQSTLGMSGRPRLVRQTVRLTAAPWYRGAHEVREAPGGGRRQAGAEEFDPQRILEIRPVSGLCGYWLTDSLGDVWASEADPLGWRNVPRYMVDGAPGSGVWRLFSASDNNTVRADADLVRRVLGR